MRSIVLFLVLALPGYAAAQEPRVAALAEAARAAPRDAGAQRAYGLALMRAGRLRESQRALAAAARLSRTSAEAQYDAARPVFETGDYRASVNACRAVERVDRNGPWARVCRARAWIVWHRSARAFEELQAAIAAAPDHFEAQLVLGEAHRLLAEVPAAETAYRRAAELSASSPAPHLGLGRLYAAANRRDDAIRELRAAIRADADDPEIQYELGRLVGGAEGLGLIRQAVAGRPGWAVSQTALGEALLATNDVEGAFAAFTEAVRIDPQLAAAHVGLGRTQRAKGDPAAAEQSIRRAIELVPNSGDAVLALAELFEEQARHEEAFAEYRRAAGLDPQNPRALLSAAKLALRLNRDVLAAGFLDRVLERNQDNGEALALYGDVMMARSNRTEARRYYERALRGRGQFDRARVQARLRELGGGRR